MYREKLWQILVPAAAVIPEQHALFSVIGCKGCVGDLSQYNTKYISWHYMRKLFLSLNVCKKKFLKSDKMLKFRYFCHYLNRFCVFNLTLRHESEGNDWD